MENLNLLFQILLILLNATAIAITLASAAICSPILTKPPKLSKRYIAFILTTLCLSVFTSHVTTLESFIFSSFWGLFAVGIGLYQVFSEAFHCFLKNKESKNNYIRAGSILLAGLFYFGCTLSYFVWEKATAIQITSLSVLAILFGIIDWLLPYHDNINKKWQQILIRLSEKKQYEVVTSEKHKDLSLYHFDKDDQYLLYVLKLKGKRYSRFELEGQVKNLKHDYSKNNHGQEIIDLAARALLQKIPS